MSLQTEGISVLFDIVETDVGPATEFASPKVRYLYEWWTASRPEGRLPLRRSFDIVEHRPIVSNVFLTEVCDDGTFVFRLLGEDVIQIVGRNPTGEAIRPGHVSEYGHALYEYYSSIVKQRICKRCVGSLLLAGKEFRRFESIDCPLTSDGERITTIIGVMDLIPTAEEAETSGE